MTCYSLSVKYHKGPLRGHTTVIYEESLSHAMQRTANLPVNVTYWIDEVDGLRIKTVDKGHTFKEEK